MIKKKLVHERAPHERSQSTLTYQPRSAKRSFLISCRSPSHAIFPSRVRIPLAFSRRMISRKAKSISSFLVFFLNSFMPSLTSFSSSATLVLCIDILLESKYPTFMPAATGGYGVGKSPVGRVSRALHSARCARPTIKTATVEGASYAPSARRAAHALHHEQAT